MAVQETFVAVSRYASFPRWAFKTDYRVITQANMKEALHEIITAERVSWDSEFEFTHHGHLVHAFSFSTKPSSGWLLPVDMDHITNLPLDVASRFLRATALKYNVCQNQEAERRSVISLFPDDFDRHCRIDCDIQVLWFHRDPNEAKDFKEGRPKGSRGGQPQGFSQEMMSNRYLRREVPTLKADFDAGVKFREFDYHTARIYACADADICGQLYDLGADPAILDNFAYKIDMGVLPVLQEMEDTGVFTDADELKRASDELWAIVEDERAKLYEMLRMDPSANVDSPTQLARHITNVLQWPKPTGGAKRKDDLISTNKQVMERMAEHPDPDIAKPAAQIKLYRSLKTLHNNYVSKYHLDINPVTQAIHSSFLLTVVPTGRLASAGPNLQNVPKKRKDGRAPVRRAFRARPGYRFLDIDYSQIELRVLAGESQEKFFLDAFANGEDMHAKAARNIFGHDDIDDDERQVGKMINFGLVYQMEAAGFAARTDFTTEEAQRFIDDYFAAMPDAVAWIRRVLEDAKTRGGVRTHFGRWRPLNQWLSSRNPSEVSFGERSAVNTVVQGTAADIMKIALIRVWKMIKAGELNARMILTVHDSLLLEIPEDADIENDYRPLLEKAMCFPIEDYPELKIDMKTGFNWYDMKELKEELPEQAPLTEEHKTVPVPALTDTQMPKFLETVKKTSPGHLHITFTLASGAEIGPIRMDGAGYQKVLATIVAFGRENKPNLQFMAVGPEADKLPEVVFS